MTEHRIDLTQLAKIRDGSGHSIYGASGSGMFLNCTGSLIPNLLATDESGEDAAYGTVAHACGENWRKTGVRPDHLIGTEVFVMAGDWGYFVTIDEEMLAYVQQSVEWSALLPGKHLVEVRVDYSDITPIPNQGGTLDFAAMIPGHCEVQDEKYGKAETIYATRNTQLMLYAYGIFREWDWLYDFQTFNLRISQPRIDNFDEWTCTREELVEFAAWCKVRMAEAWTLNAPRTAGAKQCKYCRVSASCAANAKMNADLTEGVWHEVGVEATAETMEAFRDRLDDDIEPFTLRARPIGDLTTEEMARLLPFRATAERWWKALQAELQKRRTDGFDVPGYKVVEARSRRKFINEDKAKAALVELGVEEDKLTKSKLVSPNQAEGLLIAAGHKRKELPLLLHGLVFKPAGKASLVPIADARPAIEDISASVFEDEHTTETEDQ